MTPGPYREAVNEGTHQPLLVAGAGDSEITLLGDGYEWKDLSEADRARIVACLNYCDGLLTDAIAGKSAKTDFEQSLRVLERISGNARGELTIHFRRTQ